MKEKSLGESERKLGESERKQSKKMLGKQIDNLHLLHRRDELLMIQ